GAGGWDVRRREGGGERGEARREGGAESHESRNVKAPAIPVGSTLAVQALHVQARVAEEEVIDDEHAADGAQERRIRDQPLEDVSGRIGDQLPRLYDDADEAGDEPAGAEGEARGQEFGEVCGGAATVGGEVGSRRP